MGRPESPVYGGREPLLDFAGRLRSLRQENGGRSYRQLARSAKFSAATLARAASGRSLPSWEVTRAYVVACGGDPGQWHPVWLSTARLLSRDASPPAGALPDAAPALPVRQLPADVPDFVGRHDEQEILRRLAHAAAGAQPGTGAPVVVVICGPGGVGKTALAVHAAHRLGRQFPDGQIYADLQGDTQQPPSPAQLAARFMAALGHPADGMADPVASFRSATADRSLLMVLDNAASEGHVLPILPGSARCLVIVTSRPALGALPRARTVRLDVLDTAGAVEMLSLATHLDQIRDLQASATLVELCGRLPLALRIAGAKLADASAAGLERLVEQLRDESHRLRRLRTLSLDLSAVFAMSYRPLSEETRRVFRSAGLFPGPDFSAAALSVLAGIPVIEAECALMRLVDAGLLQPARSGRYRMHELLRIYAVQCAASEDAVSWRAAAVRRLAWWYLETVQAQEAASAWYDAEHANVLPVARAAARCGEHAVVWRLATTTSYLMEHRGYTEDSVTLHRIGLACARAASDQEAYATMLTGARLGYGDEEDYGEAV